MNRSREIWGGDSDDFRPERWLVNADDTGSSGLGEEDENDGGGGGAKVKLLSKTSFEFPVFNGGPRSCLGKKMAELMACWVLVQVCREFEFEEVFGGDDGKEGKSRERRSQNSLTLPMEGGLPCLVRLR